MSTPDQFGFGIRGGVAIAPSDFYGGSGGRKPTLDQADNRLLAGGHDADTFILYGQRQFNRARLDNNPDGFKAPACIYRANHGQVVRFAPQTPGARAGTTLPGTTSFLRPRSITRCSPHGNR